MVSESGRKHHDCAIQSSALGDNDCLFDRWFLAELPEAMFAANCPLGDQWDACFANCTIWTWGLYFAVSSSHIIGFNASNDCCLVADHGCLVLS